MLLTKWFIEYDGFYYIFQALQLHALYYDYSLSIKRLLI